MGTDSLPECGSSAGQNHDRRPSKLTLSPHGVTASKEAKEIQERVLSFFLTFGVAEGDVFTFIQWGGSPSMWPSLKVKTSLHVSFAQ